MRDLLTRRSAALLLAAIAFSLPAAPAHATPRGDDDPGVGDGRGHPAAMSTSEQECWEINSVRNASAPAVQAALPEGWQPRRNRAGFALTMFVDYVCEQFSIDGLPARRTIVSWLAALAQNPSTGEQRTWTLAHGSDNPLYVQRLRKLGVDSRYLPRSTATIEPMDAGVSAFEMRFADSESDPALDYVRSGTAPEPQGAPIASVGLLWMRTTEGSDLRVDFANSTQPATTPTISEAFAAESVPFAFGIEDVRNRFAPGAQAFLRGSWTAQLRKAG